MSSRYLAHSRMLEGDTSIHWSSIRHVVSIFAVCPYAGLIFYFRYPLRGVSGTAIARLEFQMAITLFWELVNFMVYYAVFLFRPISAMCCEGHIFFFYLGRCYDAVRIVDMVSIHSSAHHLHGMLLILDYYSAAHKILASCLLPMRLRYSVNHLCSVSWKNIAHSS